MMLMRQNTCPVNYSLCNQTVTVYHKDGDTYIRTVYDRAFLDFRKTLTTDKTGSKESNSFLLVIPGDTQAVFVGDKVLLGKGAEARTYLKNICPVYICAVADGVKDRIVDKKVLSERV